MGMFSPLTGAPSMISYLAMVSLSLCALLPAPVHHTASKTQPRAPTASINVVLWFLCLAAGPRAAMHAAEMGWYTLQAGLPWPVYTPTGG